MFLWNTCSIFKKYKAKPEEKARKLTQNHKILIAAYLTLFTIFLVTDPLMDLGRGQRLLHIATEILLALLSLLGVVWLILSLRKERSSRLDQEAELERLQKDLDQLSLHMEGQGQALIESRFTEWSCSPAEREIGLLLLKGLGHREIADLRKTSERTVRKQSREIYRKSGVRGRAELAAWILDDLMNAGTSD